MVNGLFSQLSGAIRPMSKPLDAPYDLSKVDPKLCALLEKRDALLGTLPGPLNAARQSIAKFTVPGLLPSVPAAKAQDLPALLTEFDQRLATLARRDQQIQQLQDALTDPEGQNEIQQLESQHAALDQLQQSELNYDNLKRYAPHEYPALEELNDELDSEERKRHQLKRELSSWWTRIIVDFGMVQNGHCLGNSRHPRAPWACSLRERVWGTVPQRC